MWCPARHYARSGFPSARKATISRMSYLPDHPHFAGQIDLAPTPSPSEVPAPGLSDDIKGGLRHLGD
jgi:hypothetical protein